MTEVFKPNKHKCATCPFRKGGWEDIQGILIKRALEVASPICHHTGPDAVGDNPISETPMICRGARDLQLKLFRVLGFITDETDEAWENKTKELEIKGGKII